MRPTHRLAVALICAGAVIASIASAAAVATIVSPGQRDVVIEVAGSRRETGTVTVREGETRPPSISLARSAPRTNDPITPADDGGSYRRGWLAAVLRSPSVEASGKRAPIHPTPAQLKRIYNDSAITTIAAGGARDRLCRLPVAATLDEQLRSHRELDP
jgi:hypothetical protein